MRTLGVTLRLFASLRGRRSFASSFSLRLFRITPRGVMRLGTFLPRITREG
jgi:hypothetical protein